jgi:hypothetical protein
MRAAVRKTIAAPLAALTLAVAVIGAAPASAHSWPHGGFHDHHGFWGPGLALGVLGLAAGAVVASQYECVRYQPFYDSYGNYVGRHAVNIC